MASNTSHQVPRALPTWPHSLALVFVLNHFLFPFDTWIGESLARIWYGPNVGLEFMGSAIAATVYAIAAQITQKPSICFFISKVAGVVTTCLFIRLVFGDGLGDNGVTLSRLLYEIAFTGFFNGFLLQLYITPPLPDVRLNYPILWNGAILSFFLSRHFAIPSLLSHFSIRTHYDLSLDLLNNDLQTPICWFYLVSTEILLNVLPYNLARVAIVRGPRGRAIVTTGHTAEAAFALQDRSFIFRLTYLRTIPLLFILSVAFGLLQRAWYAFFHPIEVFFWCCDGFRDATIQGGEVVHLVGRCLYLALSGSPSVALDILHGTIIELGERDFLKFVKSVCFLTLMIVLPNEIPIIRHRTSATLRWISCFAFGE